MTDWTDWREARIGGGMDGLDLEERSWGRKGGLRLTDFAWAGWLVGLGGLVGWVG
jgi:hypothetical protein